MVQLPCPKLVDLVDKHIVQKWEFTEPDGSKVEQWCQGVVVGDKSCARVHVRWNKEYFRKGDCEVTEEKFLSVLHNKDVEEG